MYIIEGINTTDMYERVLQFLRQTLVTDGCIYVPTEMTSYQQKLLKDTLRCINKGKKTVTEIQLAKSYYNGMRNNDYLWSIIQKEYQTIFMLDGIQFLRDVFHYYYKAEVLDFFGHSMPGKRTDDGDMAYDISSHAYPNGTEPIQEVSFVTRKNILIPEILLLIYDTYRQKREEEYPCIVCESYYEKYQFKDVKRNFTIDVPVHIYTIGEYLFHHTNEMSKQVYVYDTERMVSHIMQHYLIQKPYCIGIR